MISLTLLGLGLVAVVFYINFGEKFVFGFLTIFDFFKRKIRQFYQFNIEREFSTLFKLWIGLLVLVILVWKLWIVAIFV